MFPERQLHRRRTRHDHLGTSIVLALLLVIAACGSDQSGGGSSDATGEIHGLVIHAFTGVGVRGATVSAEKPGDKARAKTPLAVATTASDGQFTLKDVPAGTYTLRVDGRALGPNGGSFPTEHYSRLSLRVTVEAGHTRLLSRPIALLSYSDANATPYDGSEAMSLEGNDVTVDLPKGDVSYPDLLSPPAMELAPMPVDETAVPLPDGLIPSYMVSLEPAGTRFEGATVRFPDPANQPVGTAAEMLGYDVDSSSFVVLGTATRDAEGYFTSDDAFLTEATQMVLACSSHSVTGVVVDDARNPAPGVTVSVIQSSGTSHSPVPIPGLSTLTGSDGSFTIADVRTCRYDVQALLASATGTAQAFVTGVFADPDGVVDLGTILLSPTSASLRFDIAGTVHEVDGTPQGGMNVFWSIFEPPAASKLRAWHAVDPLLQPLLEAPQPVRKGGFQTIVGADGTFRTPLIEASPGSILEVHGDGPTYFTDTVQTTTPALADNGSTVQVGFTACLHSFNCPAGTWKLTANTLDVESIETPCRPPETSPPTVTVVALNDGRLSLRIETDSGTQLVELERVKGSGPSSVTSSNLVGVYGQVAVSPPDGVAQAYLALRSDGTVAQVLGGDSQAGTYTQRDGKLLLDPTIASGQPLPAIYDLAVFGDRMTLMGSDGIPSVLQRCLGEGSSGLDGLWVSQDFSRLSAAVFQKEEYVIASARIALK